MYLGVFHTFISYFVNCSNVQFNVYFVATINCSVSPYPLCSPMRPLMAGFGCCFYEAGMTSEQLQARCQPRQTAWGRQVITHPAGRVILRLKCHTTAVWRPYNHTLSTASMSAVELLKGEGDVHIILGINCTTLYNIVPLPASRLKYGGGGSLIFSVFYYKVVLFYLHPALTLICLTRLIKQKTSRSSCSQPIPASFTKRYNDPHMWASLRSYLSWSVRHLTIQNIFIF